MDANDDLLNYELGDDLDDQDLAGDEDALLLSDEEAQLDFEDDLPPAKPIPSTQTERPEPQHIESEPVDSHQNNVTHFEQAEKVVQPEASQEEQCQSTVAEQDNDEERNRDLSTGDVEQVAVSSTNECHKDSESSQVHPDSNASDVSPSPRKSLKDDLDYSSYDNDDEPRQRHNPKTTSERDLQQNNANEFPGRNQGGFQRGRGGLGMSGRGGPPFRGGSRGGFNRGGGFPNNNNQGGPPPNNQFYPNENFNPMNGGGGGGGNPDFHHPQGPGPMPMMNNRMPGPPQMMHRPHGPPGPVGMRPDFHPNMQQGNFGRPPFQNEGPRPNMMRPPFDHAPQPHFGGGPPMNAYRPHPRMPDQMSMGPRGRPPFPPHYGPNSFNPNRMNGPPQQFGGGVGGPPLMQPYPQQSPLPQRPPMNQQPMMGGGIGPGPGNMPPSGHNAVGMAPMLPRKVLINPNFKGGGVEAATNQLMKDTLGGAQLLPPAPMSDEALLRQQEEFINKNRMHIEKRRHDRSPEPRKTRDYSPPPHRDRPGSRYGGSGTRRGHSPGGHRETGRASPKRRRSLDGPVGSSSGGTTAAPPPDPDEDEETRAYRVKIEKQKAMRDKILRDKEMRRRRAAEQKEAGGGGSAEEPSPGAHPSSTAPADASPPKQFTPLVVTQKKIISLKRSAAAAANNNKHAVSADGPEGARADSKRMVVPRDGGGGGRLAGSRAAQVKPVVIKRSLENDSDEFDEDELLADSPPPPPAIRSLTPPVISTTTSRRVVLASGRQEGTAHVGQKKESKGVFDRLERRVGVTEGAKRKLKRIVIKHLE